MKNLFKEYYKNEDDIKTLWSECVFVFDANVLLDFYSYTEKSINSLSSFLEKVKERLWIPHQVGFEFLNNRANTISKIKLTMIQTKNQLNKIPKNLDMDSNVVESELKKKYEKVLEIIDENINNLTELISNEDKFKTQITNLFDEKVGKPYSDKELEIIEKEGKKRYENMIPPGYEDAGKLQNKYGDLILWKQTLDYAKENKKSIILITSEKKDDWWLKGGEQRVQPHPSLIKEFREFTNFDFYLYHFNEFLENANKYLDSRIKGEVIKEVKEKAELISFSEFNKAMTNVGKGLATKLAPTAIEFPWKDLLTTKLDPLGTVTQNLSKTILAHQQAISGLIDTINLSNKTENSSSNDLQKSRIREKKQNKSDSKNGSKE